MTNLLCGISEHKKSFSRKLVLFQTLLQTSWSIHNASRLYHRKNCFWIC